MPSTVEQLTDNRVKLTIEIPFADLRPHLDKAYRAIAQQLTIPGFRKGHIPKTVIDQRVGKGTVLQEAVNEVLPQAYTAALQENSIVPLGQPDIELVSAEDGQPVAFTAEVDKRPDFDLPDFSTIAVTVDPAKVGDDEVEARLATMRERFATYTDVDRPAGTGDVVNVDLEGSRGGEPLAEATAKAITFKIGREAMLEGLDEAVTGLSAGETAIFTSTLLGGPLKGEDAEIHVTVNKVQEQLLPELDDDFAQLVSEFDTVDQMRADVEQAVRRGGAMEQAAEARDKALEEIVTRTNLQLPERVVAAEIAERHADIEGQLSQAGMSLDQYLTEVEGGRSAGDFWAESDGRVETALKAQLVLDKIAETRNVEVDQSDLTTHLLQRAQTSGTSPEQEMQHMMEHNHMGEWLQEIRRNKALASAMAEVVATDTDGNAVDLSVLNPPRIELPAADAAGAPTQ